MTSSLRRASTLDGAALRGAWWALRSVRGVRHDLRSRPLADVSVPAPKGLPPGAGRGVLLVLHRLEPTCLERSLVLQRWLSAQGEARSVVIGVTGPGSFRAHAWLEGEVAAGYHELTRILP